MIDKTKLPNYKVGDSVIVEDLRLKVKGRIKDIYKGRITFLDNEKFIIQTKNYKECFRLFDPDYKVDVTSRLEEAVG